MKRKVLILALVVAVFLSGCGRANRIDNQLANNTNFGVIKNEETKCLVYDKNTQIVYYMIKDGSGYKGYGYMSPYYSSDGKLCKYIDGEIQEIGGTKL